jgi:HupE / UreJ protein
LVLVAEKPDRWAVGKTYLETGITHILFGYDHLLFVIALVLLLKGFWRIAQTITAFTLAHSLTLVATTLGLVSVPSAPIEALIALLQSLIAPCGRYNHNFLLFLDGRSGGSLGLRGRCANHAQQADERCPAMQR